MCTHPLKLIGFSLIFNVMNTKTAQLNCVQINVVDVVSPTKEIQFYQTAKQQIINPNMLNVVSMMIHHNFQSF